MIILAIILGLVALLLLIVGIVKGTQSDWYDSDGWLFGAACVSVLWVVAFLMSVNLSWSTNNLTGYIYSADTRFGYTTGHIRFSEQAGQDVQPSFCAKADSEVGKQIKELAGSGTKVRVTVPPYFYFSNNPFACGTTKMTIEKIAGESQ